MRERERGNEGYTLTRRCIKKHRNTQARKDKYGVATISRLLKMIRLFCRISSLLQGSFAKESYNFQEPTNRSHPIVQFQDIFSSLTRTDSPSERERTCARARALCLFPLFRLLVLFLSLSLSLSRARACARECARPPTLSLDPSCCLFRVATQRITQIFCVYLFPSGKRQTTREETRKQEL